MDGGNQDSQQYYTDIVLARQNELLESQYSYFCSELQTTMSRTNYVCLFLNTFLGRHLSIIQPYEIFAQRAHARIDTSSLFHSCSTFFHRMVDTDSSDYIQKIIKIHKEDNVFVDSNIGHTILRCLNASKDILIY